MTFAENILENLFNGVSDPQNAWNVQELLDKFHLNWTVEKQPLYLPNQVTTEFNGVVRMDNKFCFTTCKDSFTPFQNSELAELLIRLSEKTGYKIHTGGMFNKGGKVFIQLESPNKIKNIGENRDSVNGYLTGINGHDGSTSLKWGETNITISCRNTFMSASKKVKNTARHTNGIHKQVESAINLVNGVIKEEKNLFDTFINLSEIPVKKQAIAKIVFDITGADINKKQSELQNEISTYCINRADELLKSISNEINQKGETLWGLFSGVTHYTSHKMPAPKRENGRLESIYTGSGYEINNNSLKSILEFA